MLAFSYNKNTEGAAPQVTADRRQFPRLLCLGRCAASWEHEPRLHDLARQDQKESRKDQNEQAACYYPNVDHRVVCPCAVRQDLIASRTTLFPELQGSEGWNQGSPRMPSDPLDASSSAERVTLVRLADRWLCEHSTMEDLSSPRW